MHKSRDTHNTTTLTIRRIEPRLKASLRRRADRHGRSMEAELRAILQEALASEDEEVGLATAIRRRMAEIGGGVDLPEPEPLPQRDPPDFSEW
ncbi:FitA-like ribbon-helix-helix domain-containing protein [Lutibaculum baratangense]|uniref:Antitoxin FitA-like ribbon-helix-helix domain-containing protein n=1 Tax=Lutibaculum baratangense AMV1 TaxID=631454 RepID=V4RTI5_9HYPH|nr:Arc family DNA-binding protein [Lutibaculum baratangense]ESR26390.1 hypothetical protein N177_0890 [Lutibaculum baratangense AMV1]